MPEETENVVIREEKPQVEKAWVYDATATQEIKIGENSFAVMSAYTDESAQEYEDKLNEFINENQKLQKADDEAVSLASIEKALLLDGNKFDELCETIKGETLPPNWKDDIAIEDKQKILQVLTQSKIKKVSSIFSKQLIFEILLTFNGKWVKCKIWLRKQTIADSSSFVNIKSQRWTLVEKGEPDRYAIKSLRKLKCELFKEMFISQDGFCNNDIPKRIQETIIDNAFSSVITTEGK